MIVLKGSVALYAAFCCFILLPVGIIVTICLQTKLRLSEAQQSLTLITHNHNFPLSAIGQYKKDIQTVASSMLMGVCSLTYYVFL